VLKHVLFVWMYVGICVCLCIGSNVDGTYVLTVWCSSSSRERSRYVLKHALFVWMDVGIYVYLCIGSNVHGTCVLTVWGRSSRERSRYMAMPALFIWMLCRYVCGTYVWGFVLRRGIDFVSILHLEMVATPPVSECHPRWVLWVLGQRQAWLQTLDGPQIQVQCTAYSSNPSGLPRMLVAVVRF
jgi:hypothetical protein